MNKITLITIFVVLAAGIGVTFYFISHNKPSQSVNSLDEFAICLASKNITMYGAAWCAHCQNEKQTFGNSFRFVPYVECPDNPKECLEKNITGYPTWIFPEGLSTQAGRRLIGEQGLEKLSQESGCPLPTN